MATRKQQAAAQPPQESAAVADQHPPFWVADRVLPVGAEMGGGLPARAFSPGDRVPAEHVERFGWQDYVSAPDGDWPAPELPEQPEPTSTTAQQRGSSEDEAGSAGSRKE